MRLVPREDIVFTGLVPGKPDITADELAAMTWPRMQIWRAEWRQGCKWPCGNNFLFKTLPFLATVLVQDGIHWVTSPETQHHDVSRLLVRVFGARYLDWAKQQMEKMQDTAEEVEERQIGALNAGAQAAFSSAHRNQMKAEQRGERLAVEIRQGFADMITQQQQWQQRVERQCKQKTVAVRGLGLQDPPVRTIASTNPDRACLVSLLPPPPPAEALVPQKLPNTMIKLLEEHLRHGIEQHDGVSKAHWADSGLAMRLSRRAYLHKLVVEKAKGLTGFSDLAALLQESARLLDVDRGSMTLRQFMEDQKRKDSATKKRTIDKSQGPRKRVRRVVVGDG